MYKILPTLAFLFLIPAVAFAAWWNPFTWFNNWSFPNPSEEVSVETLEERILELEAKLNETETSEQDIESKEENITVKETLTDEIIITPVIPITRGSVLPVPVVKQQQEPVIESGVEQIPEPIILDILNINVEVAEDVATIYWDTSIETDSRLVLDDDEIFVSNNHSSTEHNVFLSGLDKSRTYTYEIIAETNGDEDHFFDKFSTEREYEVTYGELDSDDCHLLIIKDTSDEPLRTELLEISGSYRNNGGKSILLPKFQEETNLQGEVKFCHSFTTATLKMVIVETNNEIFNDDISIY